ncbi:MAG: NAD-dependent epimerase/dehydratase family protein [Bryobacterales bacterium]|nr:NAD-dependent epimerase/dehydratase family protein [Bryobacterales bacterium]
MSQSSFRAAVVGAGYVADYHLKALAALPNVSIVGIADPDQTKARELAARYGNPGVYTSLKEMLAAAKPDAVHILTPPALHAPLAIEALEAGCHVFVEKPMAETAADCDRMMAAATRAGRQLSVNHSARMDPMVLEARRIAESGRIGDVIAVDFFRSSNYIPYAGGQPVPPPFRNGSYPFQDLGVHALYLMEAFLGEIKSVDARFYSTGRDPFLTFDEWRTTVECPRGIGQIYLSWNVNPMQNELTIHGTKGVIHVDCYIQSITMRKQLPMIPKPIQRMHFAAANGASNIWQMTRNFFRILTGKLKGNPGIAIAVQGFYGALASGAAPPIPASEGRRMVMLMEQVSQQADAAKQVKVDAARAAADAVPPAAILVTGAAGFLGAPLVKKLAATGQPIRVFVRRVPVWMKELPNVSAVLGDLGDADLLDRAVQGVQTVYHVGAAMRGGKEEFERGTIWGTRNMIESCLKHKVARVVYVSSQSVLDQAGHKPGTTVTEQSPCEPYPERRGLYTQTKLASEKLVLDAVRERGLPAVILRPGQIFGPGGEHFAPSGAIGLAGRWVVVGNGSHKLPLVYVDDVVDALILAAEKPGVVGQTFQLVDPTPITQNEFVQVARRRPDLSAARKSVRVPTWFMMLAARGIETIGNLLKREMPLSRYRIASLRPPYPFDISAAQNKLGWTPRIGTRAGLDRTYGPPRN